MATIVNQRDVMLQATSPRIITTAVTVTAAGGSFTKLKNAGISPSSILLTATTSGLTSPTYQWYYASSSTPATWTPIGGATSSTYTITSANYTTHRGTSSSVSYKCIATQSGWASAESISTITYAVEADDLPVVQLNKEVISLPSDANGGSVVYTGSECTIRVSIGGTYLNNAASGPNTFNVTATPSNITAGSQSGSGTSTLTFGVLSGMVAGTTTPATITYTITIRDSNSTVTTVTKVQTITKAPTGATGGVGTTGTDGNSAKLAYCKSTIASPSGTTTSTGPSSLPATGSFGLTGSVFYTSPPAITTGEYLYQTNGIYVPGTNTVSWSTPYLSNLKVGSLSAISAELGAVKCSTGGTPNGYALEITAGGSFYTDFIQGRMFYVQRQIYSSKNSADQDAHAYPALEVVYTGANTNELHAVSITKSTTNNNSTGPGHALNVSFSGANGYAGIYCSASGLYSKVGNAIIGESAGTGSGIKGINSNSTGTGGYAIFGENTGTGQAIRGETSLYTDSTNTHAIVGVKWTNAAKTTWKGGIIGPASVNANFLADGSGATDYATFTGGHDVLLPPSAPISIGDILVDVSIAGKSSPSNTISIGELSSTPNQKSVVGVYVGDSASLTEYTPSGLREVSEEDYSVLAATYKCSIMNSLGEGQVNVCGENGDLEIGDLITSSSTPGKGMKQSDDIVRNYTVAKCRENVTFSSPSEVKIVACIYLCG